MNVPQNRICAKLFSFAVLTVAILWSSAIIAETIYVGDVKDLGTNWSITEDTSVLYKDGASQKTINHSGTIAFTGSQTVTINSPTSDVTYFNQNGNMTGSGTVVKTGAGSMYFKGNYSAFSGTLKASEGFLGFMASNNADSNYNNLVVDGGSLHFCNKEFDRMVFNVSFTGNGGTFDMSSSYNNHLRSGNTSTITVPANATTTGTFSGSLNLNNGTLKYDIGANSSINVSASQWNWGKIYKTSAGTVNISGPLGGTAPNYVPTISSEEGVINIGTATTPNTNTNYVSSFQLGEVSGKSTTVNYYGGTGSLNTYTTIRFGNKGTGTFNQYSGTVNAYNTTNYLADGSGSTGTVNIYGGTFRAHSEFCIATRGTGMVNVYGGEFVANNLVVGGGYDSNAKGYLNISGGTVSAGYIKYGRNNGSTYGEISLRAGTFNLTGNIDRLSNITAKMYLGEGTINVNNNSAWDGSIGITFDGKGLNGATGKTTTINVASGKTLTMNGKIFAENGSVIDYKGTGKWVVNGYSAIGDTSNGTLNIYSGTVNFVRELYLGNNSTSAVGTLNLYGGEYTTNESFTIGTRGTGYLNIYDGKMTVAGTLNVGGGHNYTSSKGYANINGGTLTTNGISFGRSGSDKATTGVLSLRGGTINLSGGVSRLNNSSATMNLGKGTINVTANSSWVNAISINIDGLDKDGNTGNATVFNIASGTTTTIDSDIAGAGILQKTGAGTLKYTGNNNNFNGAGKSGTIKVSEGTFEFVPDNYQDQTYKNIVLDGGKFYFGRYIERMHLMAEFTTNGGTIDFNNKNNHLANGSTDNVISVVANAEKVGELTNYLNLNGAQLQLDVGENSTLKVSGVLWNSGTVYKTGTGSLNVTGQCYNTASSNQLSTWSSDGGTINFGTADTPNTYAQRVGSFQLGNSNNTNATLNYYGGTGSLTIAGHTRIGSYGTGIFNIYSGTVSVINNASIMVADETTASKGEVNVYGGSFNPTTGIVLGTRGTGTLNVYSGTTTSNNIYIGGGHATNATGYMNLYGGTVTAGQIQFGSVNNNTSIGTLNLRGGTLNLGGNVNRLSNSTSTMNLGKGTINVTANSSWVNAININIDGLDKDGKKQADGTPYATEFNIASGTTTTIDSDLSGAGILHKTGAGTLKFTGDSNNFNGAGQSGTIKVSAGTFEFIPDNYQSQTYQNIVVDGGKFHFNRNFESMHVMAEFTTNGGTIDFGQQSYNNHLQNGSTDSKISMAANATAIGYLTNYVNLNNGQLTFDVGENSTIEASAWIRNTGSIVKDGAGTLILSNANNDFESGLIINKGVVKTTSDSGQAYSCIGATSNPITVNEGGTLWIASTGRATGFHTGTVTVNGGTILIDGSDTSFGAGQTITLKGNALISSSAGTSSGAWRMRNSGFNLTVGGDSTATNATISTTSLIVHEDLKVNLVGANDVLTISSPNIYRYSNSTGTSAESLRVEGLGTLNLNSSNATFYKMLVGMDASSNVTMNVTGGKVTFNGIGSETWKDQIIGNSGIAKVNITGGELVISAGSGIGMYIANNWNSAYSTAGVSSSLNTSGTGKFTINSGLVVGTRGTAEVNISSEGNTVSSLSLGGGYDVANSKGTLNISDGSLTINGGINFGNSNSSNSTGIWKMHDATLTLNGNVNRQSRSTASATFGNATLNINANSNWASGITMTLDGLNSDGNKQADGTPYATTFNIAASTTTTINNNITGNGALLKTGTGTLKLTGNQYPLSSIEVREGTLAMTSGNINAPGIILNGGTLDSSGSSNFYFDGSITPYLDVTQSGVTSTFNGSLNLHNGRVWTMTVAENSTLQINAKLSNGGGVTKLGEGTLVLASANTYTGKTTVSEGELVIASGSGVGGAIQDDSVLTYRINSSSGKTISNAISGDGTLNVIFEDNADASWTCFSDLSNFTGDIVLSSVSGNSEKNGNKFYTGFGSTINSEATITVGTATQFYVPSDSQEIANDITITGTGNNENRGSIRLGGTISGTITVDSWANIGTEGGTISGDITTVEDTDGTLQIGTGPQYAGATFSGVLKDNGTGKLSLTLANGPLTLTGVNTYTGKTQVNAGNNGANTQLILNTKDAIATSGSVYLNNGKVVLNADQTLTNLYGNGTVTTDSNKNLTINGTLPYEESKVFSGKIQLGSGSITKTGDGVTNLYGTAEGNLSASNLYTYGGRMNLKGDFTGNLVVGKVDANNAGVILSPGNSAGTAWVHGSATFNSGSTLLIEQDASGVDQLILDNGIAMLDGSLIDIAVNPDWGASYTIITSNSGFTSEQDNAYWNSHLTPGSAYFWNLSVDGNQIRASVDPNAVPEPSTWLMLILGVAGMMWKFRSKKQEARKSNGVTRKRDFQKTPMVSSSSPSTTASSL